MTTHNIFKENWRKLSQNYHQISLLNRSSDLITQNNRKLLHSSINNAINITSCSENNNICISWVRKYATLIETVRSMIFVVYKITLLLGMGLIGCYNVHLKTDKPQ